jgi:hypothetical protein
LLTISEINPDIILLGPNQRIDINLLKEALKENNLEYIQVKRLIKYYDRFYLNSSRLIKRRIFESENIDIRMRERNQNNSLDLERHNHLKQSK